VLDADCVHYGLVSDCAAAVAVSVPAMQVAPTQAFTPQEYTEIQINLQRQQQQQQLQRQAMTTQSAANHPNGVSANGNAAHAALPPSTRVVPAQAFPVQAQQNHQATHAAHVKRAYMADNVSVYAQNAQPPLKRQQVQSTSPMKFARDFIPSAGYSKTNKLHAMATVANHSMTPQHAANSTAHSTLPESVTRYPPLPDLSAPYTSSNSASAAASTSDSHQQSASASQVPLKPAQFIPQPYNVTPRAYDSARELSPCSNKFATSTYSNICFQKPSTTTNASSKLEQIVPIEWEKISTIPHQQYNNKFTC